MLEEIIKTFENENNKLISETCCFTGHRAQKLPWKFNEADKRCIKLKEDLECLILGAINDGYKYFISGMALGVDTYCAEIVLKLRERYPEIKLICAIPCLTQSKLWKEKDKLRYENILSLSDHKHILYKEYNENCMQERNEFMINNSSLVIAVYDGMPSGTGKTIQYAKSKGKKLLIVMP